MSDILPAGQVHSVGHWLNAFFATMEVVAEQMSDQSKMQEATNSKVGKSFDMDAYRERRRLWAETRRIFTAEVSDLDKVEMVGANPNNKGELVLIANVLRVFRHPFDPSPLTFHPPLAHTVLNFLSFYMAAATQGVNPQEYVRACLVEKGITKDNWHQHKDRLAITNPWE